MIVLFHQNNEVHSIWNNMNEQTIDLGNSSIVETLFALSNMFPSDILVWCHVSQKNQLNLEGIAAVFHHKKIMASYNPTANFYLPNSIGYVEDSPFIKINKKVQFATWQMSSFVGGISSEVLQASESMLPKYKSFDYFLVSLAKLMMPLGLLCYSDPSLIKDNYSVQAKDKVVNSFGLFRFVKEHYRTRWVFILFLDFILYERKFKLFPLLSSFFYKQLKISDSVLDTIEIASLKKMTLNKTIDVIIPTIGMKKYLYDVLSDFRKQTYLPKKIIIVEQNPLPDSKSELDYLHNENWPFEIDFVFTHQAGACNARNVALSKIESNWVFFADDDIRITNDFFEEAFSKMKQLNCKAVTFSCLRKEEIIIHNRVFQWTTFGSGCSMVEKEALQDLNFDMKYEFGFGEDADFGMQLRNKGHDVLFIPKPEMLHLKAPIGGFRTKPILAWHIDVVQPKPSPTVMLFKLIHNTPSQLLGYKTVLFFKFYKHQTTKNPFGYYKKFKQQWKQSVYWAQKLNQ